MKKIYLLLAVGILAATISASAQNVILRMDNNYDVSIDGRIYETNGTLPNIGYGRHTVNVYEVKRGFLGIGKKRTVVSSSAFDLRNNDVTIDVDQYGQLRIIIILKTADMMTATLIATMTRTQIVVMTGTMSTMAEVTVLIIILVRDINMDFIKTNHKRAIRIGNK